jgi:8-oxo-dGTP pyrophosphatase MutT (NUDIX family)
MCLNFADVILFWIPRELALMPAFTTNDEWGFWKARDPLKLVLGTPKDAPKVHYQRYYAEKQNIPLHDSLEATCAAAIQKLTGIDTIRTDGERCVPLHIWRTASFQNWYQHLINAGNRLDSARVEWVFRVGPARQFIFAWVLHVDVYIAAEGRHKTNEVVIARPDISAILLYERRTPLGDSRIVLVKEFRSPVSNNKGYVFELAGGSSWKMNQNPIEVAVEECHEEVGLRLEPDRFTLHQARQLAATALSHRAHLFSAELTSTEIDEVIQNAHVVYGEANTSERTWAVVTTYRDILNDTTIDWSMLGMIASVLND